MPEVIFPGPSGRIEGRYKHSNEHNAPVALVLHPNPKQGGTMNNKVAYNLYKCFADSGFSVLRFNFRGVGRSEGHFDDGEGELTDAAAALDWLQQQNPNASSYCVGGFSFGAWIALQLLMRRPELEGFITISPPANMYDFSFLAPCPRSGTIIQGDMDSIVSEESVEKLAHKLNKQRGIEIDYNVIPKADHFFRNHMDELIPIIQAYTDHYMKIMQERGQIRPDRRRRQLPKTS